MGNYFCIRCGYSSSHKGTFLRHLGRAKPCKPKLGKFDRDDIYKHNKLIIPSHSKSTKKSAKGMVKGKKVNQKSRLTARLAADPVSRLADFSTQSSETDDDGDDLIKKKYTITNEQYIIFL